MAEREPVRNLTEPPAAAAGSALDRPLIGSLTLEKCLYIVVLLVAIANRSYMLGDRPYHHDESIHAFFSWKVVDEGIANYKYDPVYHGPVLYYASALVMKLFGDSDFTARLSAVFFGFGILALAWPLRRYLGRWAALMFLVLVTFSPALTYFTRFIRHDVFVGLGNLLAVYFAFRYAETRRALHLYVSATGLAIAFSCKEDMYALGPVMVLSLALMLVWEVVYANDWRAQLKATWSETSSLLKGAVVPILTSTIIFLVICLLFYTSLLTHRENWNPVTPALKYWWGQHEIKRIGGPWYYYFPQLLAYDPLILIPGFLLMFVPLITPAAREKRPTKILWYLTIVAFAAFIGCIFYDWHLAGVVILAPLSLAGLTLMLRWLPNRFTRFLCIWTIGCFGFYSWAQEKVPWLLFPILLPTALLAAIWFGERIEKGTLRRPLPLLAVSAVSALTLWTLIASNYLYSAPRPAEVPGPRHAELLAYVQSTYDIDVVMDRIHQVGKVLGTGEKTRLAVSGNATWPLSWYLRHYPVNWSADVRNVDTPVLIIDKEATNSLDKALAEKYEKVPFEIRGWWEPDTKLLNITTAVRWLLTREAFSGVGSSDAVMYVLKDLQPGATIAAIAVNPPPAPRGYPQAPSLDKPVAVWGVKGSGPGQFNEPRGLAVDSGGNIYVVDSKNNRVQKLSPEGASLATWGQEGSDPGQFKDPCGIAIGPDNSVYVADTWNHRIEKFDPNGKLLVEWREQTSGFWGPRGIAVSPDGQYVYVSDTGNKRIVRFDSSGKQLNLWGHEGSKASELIEPVGLAVDKEGQVHVADTGNHRVQIFSADGTFVREHMVSGWEEFYTEPYLAMLGDDLLVTDSFAHRCARYGKEGNLLYSWGKTGSGTGDFNRPIGIAADAQGAVYVSDTMNNRIQKFVLPPPGK
jgi:uncharacterized protein (TIGR03663 family)